MTADLATMWSSLQVQLEAHRPGLSGGDDACSSRPTQVPVCLLTGFLGAGKSTLLAALLGRPPGGLAVRAIVNDVGSLPFDPTLIAAGDDIRVELANGCGCCEQTGELAATLSEVAATGGVDLIVLEASGAADPFALAQIVEANPGLALDRIVAAVDGSALARELASGEVGPIVRRHVDAAHCVVVTHADRLEPDELAQVVELVAGLAPGRVVSASGRAGPAIDLLVPRGRRGVRFSPMIAARQQDLFATTIISGADVDASRFRSVLVDSRPGLLRAKGRLMLDGVPHLLQLTPSSLELTPADAGSYGITLVAVSEHAAQPIIGLLAAT